MNNAIRTITAVGLTAWTASAGAAECRLSQESIDLIEAKFQILNVGVLDPTITVANAVDEDDKRRRHQLFIDWGGLGGAERTRTEIGKFVKFLEDLKGRCNRD